MPKKPAIRTCPRGNIADDSKAAHAPAIAIASMPAACHLMARFLVVMRAWQTGNFPSRAQQIQVEG
jgi:hypothetical protein